MSDLFIIGYDSKEKAEEVLETLQALQNEYLVDLDDAAVVTRTEKGKLKVSSDHHLAAVGGLGGMFWGFLIGLIFLVPVGGMILGGLFGAAFGAVGNVGIDDAFKKQAGDLLAPGTSAIVAIVRKATPDKVLEAIAPYGGEVLRTSLTDDAEERLQKALHGE